MPCARPKLTGRCSPKAPSGLFIESLPEPMRPSLLGRTYDSLALYRSLCCRRFQPISMTTCAVQARNASLLSTS